jgi:ubiquitin-conjugating enzyme E2 D/E
MKWIAIVAGPKNTPFEGGKFKVSINFPSEYPYRAPELIFLTPIYHPNVDSWAKHVCLNSIDYWRATSKVWKVFVELIEVLKNPVEGNSIDAMVRDVWLTDPKQYENTAREWTKKHAN